MLAACINIGINEVTLIVADIYYRTEVEVLAVVSCPIFRNSKTNSPSLFRIAESIELAVAEAQLHAQYIISRVFVSVSSIYTKSFSTTASIPICVDYVQQKDIERLVAALRWRLPEPMWSIQQVLAHSVQIDGQEKCDSPIYRRANYTLTIYAHLIGGPAGLLADACTACHMCGLKVYDAITNHAVLQIYTDIHSDYFGNTLSIDIGDCFTSVIFYDGGAVSYSKITTNGCEQFCNRFYNTFLCNKTTVNKILLWIDSQEIDSVLSKVSNRKKFIPNLCMFYFLRKQKIYKFFLMELYNFFYQTIEQISVEKLQSRQLTKIVLIGEFFRFPRVHAVAEHAFRELNESLDLKFVSPHWPIVSLSDFNQFTAVFGNLIYAMYSPSTYCNFFLKIMYTLQLWLDDLI